MVKPSAFLALESSLSLRLSTTLEALTSEMYKTVQTAIEDKQWDVAERVMRSLNLSIVFTSNEPYIRYLSKLALLFGASRVTRTPGTSAVGLGFESSAVNQWVESFRLGIEYNLQETLIATGLQLIAQARDGEAPKEEKFSVILKDEGSYLGTVLKTAKQSAMLPFASFMGKEGTGLFNVASSLHTSRLSAFGYTAEAEYLGITTYQINEQLDGRTCPVCALMHRKTFKVSDARALLDTVIRTQDPDELKSLQPWPSQSAQAVADLKTMTTAELVSRGWHVPPFHPRCRGLLSKVGTVPELTAGKPAKPTPENYVSTKEDFLQLGIQLSPSKIDLWNSLIQTSPAEVIANLKGSPVDQLLADIQGQSDPQTVLGLSNLSVSKSGVNVELQTSAFGSKHPVVQDYYFRKDQSLYVGLIKVHQEDTGVVKKLLRSLFGTAKSTSMKSIQMVADDDISGYAWAKYGFSLSPRQWGLVKSQIKRTAAKMEMVAASSPVEQKAVNLILESTDPKSIFALADLKLGKSLLSDTSWIGTLEFDDAESVTRFISAMGK